MDDTRTLQVGAVRVIVLNGGNMALRLADEMAVPESQWRPQYADLFERRQTCPGSSVLIQHGDATILVDAGDYRATVTADSPFYLPDYTPPPAIPAQLESVGVWPEDVTAVVLTHAHWDHFAGTTRQESGGYIPTYPRAHYYLGASDWADAELQAGLQDPSSLEGRTLGVLSQRGVLELVSEPLMLADGIEVRPAPGETPGHQIVRIHSQGQTLYVLGDLFHHPVEVEHPDWMVSWANPEAMLTTRRRVLGDALAEDALLTAAHIDSIGRLERTADGVRWQAV